MNLLKLGKTCGRLLLWAALLSAVSSQAQTVFGNIVGTVTDSSGAVVPGAKVQAIDEALFRFAGRANFCFGSGEDGGPLGGWLSRIRQEIRYRGTAQIGYAIS